MIEFLCPEGHRIRCPKEKAGRPAKCPKCGVEFRIPTIEELGLAEAAASDPPLVDSEPDGPVAAEPADAMPSTAATTTTKERQIEFLCPNGHHLHGPASLQGRAGECPECGSRFRIPVVDEPDMESFEESLEAPELAPESETPLEEEITLESPAPHGDSPRAAAEEPLDFLQSAEGSSKARLASAGQAAGGFAGAIVDLSPAPVAAPTVMHPLAAYSSNYGPPAARAAASRSTWRAAA